jgi:hypothetical protein
VDGLAKSYSRQPIVFLEYQRTSEHAVRRIDRFLGAWAVENPAGSQADTPMAMVDSGLEVREGECNYRVEYGEMIQVALPRAPLVSMWAQKEMPDPSTVVVRVQVENTFTDPLDSALNDAALHVIVYEGHRALHTGREIHGSAYQPFHVPLGVGESRRFEFTFDGLRGVNASLLEAVAMVDYLPDRRVARWEMMQAAFAGPGDLPAMPTPAPTDTPAPTATTKPPTAVPTDVPTEAPTETPLPTATPDPEAEGLRIYLPVTFDTYARGS